MIQCLSFDEPSSIHCGFTDNFFVIVFPMKKRYKLILLFVWGVKLHIFRHATKSFATNCYIFFANASKNIKSISAE